MACDAEHFGNFDQTLFLGCSVVSFSADMGWNEQSSQVTVELVEDDCPPPTASPKKYWDTTLTQRNWTLADPGFIGRQLYIFGLPAYFRLKDFEFTGLIQSWEEVENSSGKRYIVKLITPTSILENTKLIIGSYAGGIIPAVGTPYAGFVPNNLINIYGYAEAQGILCPQWYQSAPGTYNVGDGGLDGAVFGTPAGGFGGSLTNHNGMPWYMIRNLINVLVNAFPVIGQATKFTAGRLVGRGHDISTVPVPLPPSDEAWKDWTQGFGLLSSDKTNNDESVMEYFVDISELPIVPDFLRFNQTEISLLDGISRVCQEAGYDFYIETLPVSIGGSIDTIIKVRTVSRRSPPVYGKVDTYIAAAKEAGILRGSSVGTEYRNEINSRFIIGGQKETLYQAPQDYDPEGDGHNTYTGPPYFHDGDVVEPGAVVLKEVDDVILPFFGLRDDETMIVPYINSGFWEFQVDTIDIEGSLNYITFSGLPITITEGELFASISHDIWNGWRVLTSSDTNTIISNTNNVLAGLGHLISWDVNHLSKALGVELERISGYNDMVESEPPGYYVQKLPIDPERQRSVINARDTIGMGLGYININDHIQDGVKEDIATIHAWVASFADEYYGKKFAVRVPQSCVYTDEENNQLTYSEQPSQGGGWTEVTSIFGLATTGADIGFFRNDSNKIETIVAWTSHSGLNFSAHDESTYILREGNIYLKGTVDSDYVFHDMNGTGIPRAIVSIPSPVVSGGLETYDIVQGLAYMLSKLPEDVRFSNLAEQMKNLSETVASKTAANKGRTIAYIPDGVAFGMKSNIDTYGPWVSIGTVGGIEIDQDQGLVPWEYNGYENLNLAGSALAEAGLTNMQASEVGNISVVGTPTIPLGAELNSLSLLTNNHLFENRGMVTGNYTGTYANDVDFDHDYKYFDFGFVPSGVEGPNVTNISINIGTEVTTQYQFRTYTPKYGRFAKINADRLKEVSQNKMKVTRDLRAMLRNNELTSGAANSSMNSKSALYHNLKGASKNVYDRKMDIIGTPHELFIGQISEWGEDRRPIICTSSLHDLKHELSSGTDGYDSKSIASLDSLIRPISMQGAGGLPRLITPLGSESGIMPTGTDGGSGSVPLTISQIDLVPYINPATGDESQHILFRRYNTGLFGSNLGHDIDMVSRTNLGASGEILTSGMPSGGLVMNNMTTEVDGFDYQDDYRTFALRGPLLVQSWGYDTDDNPIPNQVDTPSGIVGDGVYESSGLSGSFMSGWLRRSDTWPVAPLDLRLNRELGLWQVKAASDAGSAYVTEEITAAVYDDSPADDGPASGSKTITFGSGTMEQYSAITGSGSYDMKLNGVQETVFTIASEITPVGKHIHWMTIDNRKMMIVEPCI